MRHWIRHCVLSGCLLLSMVAIAQEEEVAGELKQWHPVTITFSSEMTSEDAAPNPFVDYRLDVTFSHDDRSYTVPGYYAADGLAADTSAASGNKWRVHFTPDETGLWTYAVSFRTGSGVAVSDNPSAGTAADLDGTAGSFVVAPTDKKGRDHRGKGMLRYVNARYLKFAGSGEPFVKGGTSGPENFLAYSGFDQTLPSHSYAPHAGDWHQEDPSWRGTQGRTIIGALNYAARTGLNAVSMLTVNVASQGADVWPWTGRDVRDRFDCSKLDQWDMVFAHMDKLGLLLHLELQAPGSNAVFDGGELGDERKLYYREMVARFGHHLALVWDIGLPDAEMDVQRQSFAAYLRGIDPYHHPIVCRAPLGQGEFIYEPMLNTPNFEGPSLQAEMGEALAEVDQCVKRSAQAGRPWVVCLDGVGPDTIAVTPDGPDNNHDAIRKSVLWNVLMAGGAGCAWNFGAALPESNLTCEDWHSRENMWNYTRHALKFFESYLPFDEMTPRDDLVAGGLARCLASTGEIYALYLPSGGSVSLDLEQNTSTYAVYWYDPRHGGPLKLGATVAGPGVQTVGPPPEDAQEDWAALIVSPSNAPNVTTIQILNDVVQSDSKRLGLNVPSYDPCGAGQIMKDLIRNPGFESGVYGMIFHVGEGATGTRIPQAFWDPTWNDDADRVGQPAGFWDGARYEILSGPARGRTGVIQRYAPEGNANIFQLDSDGVAPEPYDAISVRATAPGFDLRWADPTQARPGSPGTQSLHLTFEDPPWDNGYKYYMDTGVYSSTEKFYIVRGRWRIEFWAKGKAGGEVLSAVFARHGEATFHEGIHTLTTQWQKFEAEFDAPDGLDKADAYAYDDRPALVLSLYMNRPGDEAWVDDLSLRRVDYTNPTIFSDPFVARLKELRPGVLRNWTVQLGDTLDNQLAAPFARKTHGFQPDCRDAELYDCSFHEFLELCKEVGCEPWYVIAPTFTREELINLVAYLALPVESGHAYALKRAALGQTEPWTTCFESINLEFGNELWGAASGDDPFFGASLLGGTRMAQVAHDRLAFIKSAPGFDVGKFNLVIGGQYGWTPVQTEIEQNSSNHDTVAIAPYFGEVFEAFDTDDECYYPLFARAIHDVENGSMRQSRDAILAGGHGTAMGVYEMNFHTTYGDVPIAIRNDFVTGAAGAIAMPLYALTYMRDLGATYQCAFTAVQFDWRMDSGDAVRLWGMLRDIESTGRKRPTWLGAETANHAITGDMVDVMVGGENPGLIIPAINGVEEQTLLPLIQAFAFRDDTRYGVVVFNLDLEHSHVVEIAAPEPFAYAAMLYQVAPLNIHDDNEDANRVVASQRPLEHFAVPHGLELPKHSVSAITWEHTVRDSDGDGFRDDDDAFPDDPDEWEDADNDQMGDNFEHRLLEIAQTDNDPTNDWMQTLQDIDPNDDFDHDGSSNIEEFRAGSNPADPLVSVPVMFSLVAVSAGMMAAWAAWRLRRVRRRCGLQ